MRVFIKREELGIAALEAAAGMFFLLLLALGVFGVVDFMQTTGKVRSVVNMHLYDSGVKGLAVDGVGEGSLVGVNRKGVGSYLEQWVEGVERDLVSELKSKEGQYFLEAAYAEISIDTNSGMMTGKPYLHRRIAKGSSRIASPDLLERTDFAKRFSEIGAKKMSNGQSLWAAPLPATQGNTASRFLPARIVVGMRVFHQPSSTTTWLLSLVGKEDLVFHDSRVFVLRGEVEL